MKKLIVSCFVVGMALNVNAQNYWKKNAGKSAKVIFTNSKTNEKMVDKGMVKFEKMAQPKETDACIFVDPDFKYQKLIGIGGAITDASAETFYKLPKNKQKEIIEAYYGKNGLGYTVVRTNMNSCDFSSDSYTYVTENDKTLKSFNVAHDEKYKIPMIRKLKKQSGKILRFTFLLGVHRLG